MATTLHQCPYCHKPIPEPLYNKHVRDWCKVKPVEASPVQEIPATSPEQVEVSVGGEVEEELAPRPEPTPVSTPGEVLPISPPTVNGHRLAIPAVDPNYLLPSSLIRKMKRIQAQSKADSVNVMVLGPQGCGKTSLARQFAAIYQRPYLRVPCVTMQEPQEWWGRKELDLHEGKGTYYVPSIFVNAINTPGVVINLDDANRVENPKVLNPLLPILDDDRETWIQEMDSYLKVIPGTVFFATANEGWEFQGTDPLDRAFRDRYYQIKLDYPKSDTITKIVQAKARVPMATATRLATFATSLAEAKDAPVKISLRQLLLVAKDMAAGATMREAIIYCVTAGLPEDSQQAVLLALQQAAASESELKATADIWETWT